jgi:hypothetical protein
MIWHKAYRRWYDHREAGHVKRAKLWGYLTDVISAIFYPNGAR